MPIKPVNYQVMLPKAAEVSKLSTDEQFKSQLNQQQQATTVQNKAENSIKQVYSREKAEEAKIREKQEKEGNSKRQGKKKQQEKESKNKDFKSAEKTSTIDIRL